jgi:hypothetical protein
MKYFGTDAELVHVSYENTTGLSEIYNRYLTNEYKDCYVVFLHDDISIEDAFFFSKIEQAFKKFDIIGLAGAKNATLKSPILWHLLSEESERSGAVGHYIPNSNIVFMSSYGPSPARCLLLDGLFLGVNVNKALEVDLKFDEQFKWHFYDIDLCLSANAKGLTMGTWPIWAVHGSLGTSCGSQEWKDNEKYFLDKWN